MTHPTGWINNAAGSTSWCKNLNSPAGWTSRLIAKWMQKLSKATEEFMQVADNGLAGYCQAHRLIWADMDRRSRVTAVDDVLGMMKEIFKEDGMENEPFHVECCKAWRAKKLA